LSGRGLLIYSRRDCSLCERMEAGVRALAGPAAAIRIVEIDDDPELVRRYGADIPVLCLDGEVVCRHFLDADRLAAALAQQS
jgi:hypothetical protein